MELCFVGGRYPKGLAKPAVSSPSRSSVSILRLSYEGAPQGKTEKRIEDQLGRPS